MKKNVYIRSVITREKKMKTAILNMFLGICSYPRQFLELLIRKNFGERYFNLGSTLFLGFMFAIVPSFSAVTHIFISGGSGTNWGSFLGHYLTWYAYLAVYLYYARLHYKELKHGPSVYDFERYTKSAGVINEFFFMLKLNGKEPSKRQVEIWLEPSLFFCIGIVLLLFHQPLGAVLMICAIVYSLSYAAQYWQGDNFMMDMIDKRIINEQLEDVFVNDRDPNHTKGFSLRMKKPTRMDMRKEMLNNFYEGDDDDVPEVA